MDLSALKGRRLLVPVTAQRRHLAIRLAEAGAVVEEAEFISIAAAEDEKALEAATLAWCAGDYAWLAVTSRNALLAMDRVAKARGVSLAAPLPDAKVATVGEATRGVCADLGLDVELVPQVRQNARGIVDEFPDGGGRVLAPLGNLAAPVLERGLSRKGWNVDVVEAYRTVDGPGVGKGTRKQLAEGEFDAVLLTSGSVAERFAAAVGDLPDHTMVVAIGDMTAASARAAGLKVDAIATAPSYDGIVAGLLEALDPDDVETYDDDDEVPEEDLEADETEAGEAASDQTESDATEADTTEADDAPQDAASPEGDEPAPEGDEHVDETEVTEPEPEPEPEDKQ